jgi:hypothetical protein
MVQAFGATGHLSLEQTVEPARLESGVDESWIALIQFVFPIALAE